MSKMCLRDKNNIQKLKGKCFDLLVSKEGVGLDAGGATTDILSDCLDTRRVTDTDSAEIEDILWLKLPLFSWVAKEIRKEHALYFKE